MVLIPGSKSHTNRALIMAALTPQEVVLRHPLYCDDTEAMISCLQILGIQIETHTDHLIVRGDVSQVKGGRQYHLEARGSGTTARFLLALCCLVPGVKVLQGNEQLSRRPIHDLVEALRSVGAQIDYLQEEGRLPLRVRSECLEGNQVAVRGDVSSQFCSALLLIAPLIAPVFCVQVTGDLISAPYVAMTCQQMRKAGVNVYENRGYLCVSQEGYQQREYVIEGDFSTAGYFFAMAALTRSCLTCRNLCADSLQADRELLSILETMGNRITYRDSEIEIEGRGVLPINVNMQGCPDQVMTVAVLAAFGSGITTISGVRSLRVKESNRVEAVRQGLAKMGIETEETEDTLTVYGKEPCAASIATYGDHRIAMAFAVAGTVVAGMQIENPEVVCKTCPSFWELYRSVSCTLC